MTGVQTCALPIWKFCGTGPYVQRVRYLWMDGRRYKTGRFTSANAPAHVEGNGAILVLGDGSGMTVIFR